MKSDALAVQVERRILLIRGQKVMLDADLANALSVAPAPHSWRDAEERVLLEFGDNFSTPTPADAHNPSPHKEYFVGDPEYVSERFDDSFFQSIL